MEGKASVRIKKNGLSQFPAKLPKYMSYGKQLNGKGKDYKKINNL